MKESVCPDDGSSSPDDRMKNLHEFLTAGDRAPLVAISSYVRSSCCTALTVDKVRNKIGTDGGTFVFVIIASNDLRKQTSANATIGASFADWLMRTWVTFMDSMTVGIGESRINRSCPAPNTKTAASRISLRVENSLAIQTVTGTDTTIAEAYNSTRSAPAAKSLGKVITCHESTRHRRSVQDLSVFRDFNHGVRRAAPTLNVSYHTPQPPDRVIIPCATARSRGRTRDHCQPVATDVLRTPNNNDVSAVFMNFFISTDTTAGVWSIGLYVTRRAQIRSLFLWYRPGTPPSRA